MFVCSWCLRYVRVIPLAVREETNAIFVCSWCLRCVGSAFFWGSFFFAVCVRMLLYAWLGVLLYLVALVPVYAVKGLNERFMLVGVLLYVHCACVCVCVCVCV